MAYVHVTDNTPTKINLRSWLRANHPNVSFPEDPTEALLATYDVYPMATDRPAYDPATEVEEYQGIIDVAGTWTETWTVRAKTQVELDAEVTAKKDRVETQLSADLSALKAIAAGLEEHENRIRALEGNATTVSLAQVIAWLKGKL